MMVVLPWTAIYSAVMGSLKTPSHLKKVSRQYFHCLGLVVSRPRQFKTPDKSDKWGSHHL